MLLFVATTLMIELPHYLRQVGHALNPSLGRYRTLQLVTLTIWIAAFTLSVLAGALSVKEPVREVA